MQNLVIIGMPGCGKSTFGRRLAKLRGQQFIDTDWVIEQQFGCDLQQVVNRLGQKKFRELEAATVCELDCRDHIISTGGSVIYSSKAMTYLSSIGSVLYLRIHLNTLLQRVNNKHARGLAKLPGKSLQDLYFERLPLYAQWADIILDNDRPLSAWQMDRLMKQIK